MEGSVTRYLPSEEVVSVYDASMRYASENVSLVVVTGKGFGTGSSRDWAAKGQKLLGIRAVIAESFERIHRDNLVGMGLLPLQFQEGEGAVPLGIDGSEQFDILAVSEGLRPGGKVTLFLTRPSGERKKATLRVRLDAPIEVEYYLSGGILDYVLQKTVSIRRR